MIPLLVDAGALVAALNRSDTYHAVCRDVLQSPEYALVTCEAVVSEALFVLRRARAFGAEQDILRDIHRGAYQLPLQLKDRASSIAKLMKKYADVPMSLADACLVDLATQLDAPRILTLDSDFQLYRWGRNRKFDLLIDLPTS